MDICRRNPVMVNNGNPIAGIEKILLLNLLRPVCIHNDEKRLPVGMDNGILRRGKGIAIFRYSL